MDKNNKDYDSALVAFVERHPAAKNWLKGKLLQFYINKIFSTFFSGRISYV